MTEQSPKPEKTGERATEFSYPLDKWIRRERWAVPVVDQAGRLLGWQFEWRVADGQ